MQGKVVIMARVALRKRLLSLILCLTLLVPLPSCGTILHPERVGQPPGRLDPGIVILDAVGLILFFVPGVIAFIVDFSTGAIYLPHQGYVATPVIIGSNDLRTVHTSPADLTPARLESVIQEQTGQTIRLAPGAYQGDQVERARPIVPRDPGPDAERRGFRQRDFSRESGLSSQLWRSGDPDRIEQGLGSC
jgi:hypothetical protein